MGSLRDIKKDIEFVISEFVDDCNLFLKLKPGKFTIEVTDLVDEAVELYNNLRDRVLVPEGEKKAYYNGLRKELLEKADSLYDRFSELVKKSNENA